MAADKKPAADANKPGGGSGGSKEPSKQQTAPSTSKDAAAGGKDTKATNEKKATVDTEDLVRDPICCRLLAHCLLRIRPILNGQTLELNFFVDVSFFFSFFSS